MPQISVKISQEVREVWFLYMITRQTISLKLCQILHISGSVDLDHKDPMIGNGLMDPHGILKAGGPKKTILKQITQDLIMSSSKGDFGEMTEMIKRFPLCARIKILLHQDAKMAGCFWNTLASVTNMLTPTLPGLRRTGICVNLKHPTPQQT